MTVAATASKVIYAGDGSSTLFSYSTIPTLPNSDGSEMKCFVVDADGEETELTSNYNVDASAKTITYPVTAGVAPLASGVTAVPIGWSFVIARRNPLSQLTSWLTQGIFDGPTLESALDKILMIAQELQEQVNRSFKAPINLPDNETSPVIPPSTVTLTYTRGTLAELVTISNASPLIARYGYATDIGNGQLVFYPGYVSTGGISGTGWYAIAGGM
jgi:hypothetical protein